MKIQVTHENFDSLMGEVKAGKAVFLVPTYTHCTKVDNKCLERFEKAKATPLKKSNDGRGFLLASGRKFVYVTYDGLVAVNG
jgi:hypothetical protein